jgi:predicted DNA-binding transcriptional regulator YafY
MKASRLLSILTTLQARGRATATELASENEVSLRTIYRDIDALSAAGVPVYSERGADGGYRLLDGYRTRLNGLSAKEAEALFMIGLAGPAADLGLGAVMATAENKLLSAIPAALRDSAAQTRGRFHLDAPAWFTEAEQPAHLPDIANAVWEQRALRIRYQSWKGEKHRVVEPLGIVLKSGAWYLVGQVDGMPRTYRISRILDLTVLDQPFERRADFDLEAYWRAGTQRLEADLHQNRAVVSLSPMGIKLLDAFVPPFVRASMQIEDTANAKGWRKATMPVGSNWQACVQMLQFGAEIEVLDPPDLRAQMTEIATALHATYARQTGTRLTEPGTVPSRDARERPLDGPLDRRRP